MIALPRLSAPSFDPVRLRALIGNRYVGVGAAGVLLAAAVAALLLIVAPAGRHAATVRLSLKGALAHAPDGWNQALRPAQGRLHIDEDVVRLSERPLAPLASAPWNRPAAAAQPFNPALALPAAPIAGLFATGPGGPLPVIARDGRTPFDAYRRPFLSNGRPKVALVIGGLGLNARATQQAIETLPPEITLSFAAYADGLQGWVDMARAHGHEVLLETPMEPVDYPDNDPGPYTLMAQAPAPETVHKLEWVLSRTSGYFGLTNYLGSRFLATQSAYATLATVMRGRGLAFIDDGSASGRRGGGVARASAERVIDGELTQAAIDQQLLALEASATQRGQALGSGFAYPVTVEKVASWAQGLDHRGLQLAPASAVARP